MDFFNLEPIDNLIKELKNASYGRPFDEGAAILNAETQKHLIIELSTLQHTISNSTDKLIKTAEQNSKSSDGIAKALVLTTWILAIATFVVAFVTIFPFIWNLTH